jgi:hypothetical protein
MNDALLVRRLEPRGDLPCDGDRLANRQRALAEPVLERRPLYELKDERADAVRLLESMDRRDMRMVERGKNAGLALEARAAIGIVRKDSRQDLDRDVAAQPAVARAIHPAHPAGAGRRDNFVRSQTTADLHMSWQIAPRSNYSEAQRGGDLAPRNWGLIKRNVCTENDGASPASAWQRSLFRRCWLRSASNL